jgi:radical SAM superfamily enzyme YgiQ (UPF0313 family)
VTDFLLTHGFFLHADPAEQRVMRPYVPLGILSIAASVRRDGFTVEVFDSTFSGPEAFDRRLHALRPAAVGIYVTLMTRTGALRLARAARAAGAIVIVGGPEPAGYAEEFLAQGCDIVVVGEGEQTVAEILGKVRRGSRDFRSVDGIVFRAGDGSLIRTSPRSRIRDLDTLPLPARDLVDFQPYLTAWKARHGYTSLSIVTMRGCPYTCSWCSHSVYGESYRRRSPARSVEELEFVLATYSPDALWFADDVFTISHRWLFAFRDELAARRLRLRYECITRADRLSEEAVAALRETGCSRVWIGSESGSQRILDAMSRGVTVEQVRRSTAQLQRAGIEVGMFIMFGYPGETDRDVELTIAHVRAARPDIVLSTVAYPIRGTRMHRELNGRLQIPPLPFEEWNDRMISIPGRRSRRYYWFAHRRLVHATAAARERDRGPRGLPRFATSFLKAGIARVGMRLA